MPIVLRPKGHHNMLCESQYHILLADSIEQLSEKVGWALERNIEDYETSIYTVKGGPVYDVEKKKWCQAIVSNRWIC